MSTPKTICWFELPVSDLEAAETFYKNVFGYETRRNNDGPNPIVDLGSSEDISGHLYPGKPAENGNGPTIHLVLPGDLEDGIAACQKAGGKVISPAIEIPPGRFAYALDPDGNSIGLFEPNAA